MRLAQILVRGGLGRLEHAVEPQRGLGQRTGLADGDPPLFQRRLSLGQRVGQLVDLLLLVDQNLQQIVSSELAKLFIRHRCNPSIRIITKL